jgi:hypothetical protein
MFSFFNLLTPEAWTALATWVLVAGTLVAVGWQVQEQRKLHAFDVAMKLSERYNSHVLRKHRKRLASALLEGPLPDEPNESSQFVIEFFDDVGMLIGNGMLREDLAWHQFGFATLHYHGALAARLAWIQRTFDDKTIHQDFADLFSSLLEIECKKRHISREAARPTTEAVQDFLRQESKITVE